MSAFDALALERPSMRLLEALLSEGVTFPNTVVLHINHCMDNSFYFSEQLLKVYGAVVFIAVPYNDRQVPEALGYIAYHGAQTKDGYALSRNNAPVDVSAPSFFEAVRCMISLALEREIEAYLQAGMNLLIMEDGGYHYPIVRRWLERCPHWHTRVLGAVEQTTAGTRSAWKNSDRHYPVVSVARSSFKIGIEAYFIAERIAGELQWFLRRLNSFLDFHTVLMVGYGVIGRSIACCLSAHHMRINVLDVDARISDVAIRDGYMLWDGVFRDEMLVVGSVGKPSFTVEMLNSFLKGDARRIYLASASSKQVEFQDIFPRLEEVERIRLTQGDIYRFAHNKELVLLARGFPINFYDKSTDSLTYGMIDPVFSEMFCCACLLSRRDHRLESKTYLFGVDEQVGGEEKELMLLDRWMRLYRLHIDVAEFNRHPEEKWLRYQTEGRENRDEL